MRTVPPLGMAAWGLKPIVAVVTAPAVVVPRTTLVFVMDPAASAIGARFATRQNARVMAARSSSHQRGCCPVCRYSLRRVVQRATGWIESSPDRNRGLRLPPADQ